MDLIRQNFEEAQNVLQDFLNDEDQMRAIELAGKLLIETYRKNGKIISCGNGGSMCDAIHFAEELSGKFRNNRPALPAISISDPAHITCVGNDFGFEAVFSRYVEAVGDEGDVFACHKHKW